jgi:TolA-binding protein
MVVSTPLDKPVRCAEPFTVRRPDPGRWRWAGVLVLVLLLGTLPGCQVTSRIYDGEHWFWQQDPVVEQTLPEDSIVLRNGNEIVRDQAAPVYGGDLEGAKRLFQQKEYAKAEPIFDHIADSKKNTFQVMEDALFYQAECLYHRRKYPSAADHYIALLNTFPSAAHGKEVRDRLFAIANYWLDETRDDMEAHREYQDGKRWMVLPSFPLHFFDETKPDFDIEGRACKCLEAVAMTDPRGELGAKTLFMLGSVKFFREEYKEADHFFYQIVQNPYHAKGPFAPKALQLSIICKEICTGGPDYDGRRLQEARELITMARNSYPELAQTSDQFLVKQTVAINQLSAEKDYNIAKFWERTGHPGSAYFYYEIVKRRYPGTDLADKAEKRMIELKARAEREQARDHQQAPEGTPADNRPPTQIEQGPPPRVTPGPPLPPAPGMLPSGVTGAPR